MNFISHAQNFEDVMLWRALMHVEKGFYIDVGANAPDVDSVTKAFYERGWSGINIEPLLSHHLDLERERPRDINLRCAAGAFHGEINLWECDIRGWATADKSVIAQHSANGHKGIFYKVPVLTLTEICAANAKNEIHFLKVDVEGFEKSVIKGMDFSRFRPWILVIEATQPNSTIEVYNSWESIITVNGYSFGYADGLNRFYVANEHAELLASLRYPPNVLDGFALSENHFFSRIEGHKAQQSDIRAQQEAARALQAESQSQQSEAKALELEQRLAAAEVATHQALQHANEWHARVDAIENCNSWKITKPLRALAQIVKRQSTVAEVCSVSIAKLRQSMRTWSVSMIKTAGVRARSSPGFKRFALRLLRGHPSIQQKLRRIYSESQHKDQPQPANWPGTPTEAVTPLAAGVQDDSECVFALPPPRGINANQRSPLEENFPAYRGRP